MKTIKFNTLKYLACKNELELNQAFNIRMSIFPINKNISIRELRMYNIQRLEWYLNLN